MRRSSFRIGCEKLPLSMLPQLEKRYRYHIYGKVLARCFAKHLPQWIKLNLEFVRWVESLRGQVA